MTAGNYYRTMQALTRIEADELKQLRLVYTATGSV